MPALAKPKLPSKTCESCGNVYAHKERVSHQQFSRSRACSNACACRLGTRTWPSLESRFWEKVDKNGPLIIETQCWLWTGCKLPFGYGQFKVGRINKKAHRVSYILAYGDISDELLVRHRCDNPSCVRPEHLITGTDQDNSNDAVERGRTRALKGEDCPHHKLTIEQVSIIRFTDITSIVAQKRFGISRCTVYGIRKGRIWKDVTAPVHQIGFAA